MRDAGPLDGASGRDSPRSSGPARRAADGEPPSRRDAVATGDEPSTLRVPLDKPLLLEPPEGPAQRGAADLELSRQRALPPAAVNQP